MNDTKKKRENKIGDQNEDQISGMQERPEKAKGNFGLFWSFLHSISNTVYSENLTYINDIYLIKGISNIHKVKPLKETFKSFRKPSNFLDHQNNLLINVGLHVKLKLKVVIFKIHV